VRLGGRTLDPGTGGDAITPAKSLINRINQNATFYLIFLIKAGTNPRLARDSCAGGLFSGEI